MTPKWSALAITAVPLLAVSLSTRAASLYTETFSGSTGGWQDREIALMSVTNVLAGGNPGGCLSGSFPFEPIPSPAPDAFMATGALATASFVGSYSDADAWLAGFDFRANQVVPSTNGLQFILRSGSKFIYRPINNQVNVTGQWYRFRFPLLDTQLGGWLGDTADFSSILTNVTRFEVEITRNGSDPQTYLLDNIFLDRLPAAVALGMSTGGVEVTWLHMRAGETYRFEAASDMNQGGWVVVSNVVATGGAQVLTHETTNVFQGYRVVIP